MRLNKSYIICLCLAMAGLVLIIYPYINNYKLTKNIQESIEDWEQAQSSIDYNSIWDAVDNYNATLVNNENQFIVSEADKEYINSLINPYGTGLIGYISIPKINVYLPIYYGTEERVLQSGCGLLYGSSVPSGGDSTHTVLTAHNGLIKSKMFTDIDKLKNGDEFTLHILGTELKYEVIGTSVNEPGELTGLFVEEGKRYTTLYTCTPFGVNSHRLLVRGQLVN